MTDSSHLPEETEGGREGVHDGAQKGAKGAHIERALPGHVGRHRLPNRRAHELVDFQCGGFRFTGGVGHFDDGRLAEVFLASSKTGTAIDTVARDSAVVASVALHNIVAARGFWPFCPGTAPWQTPAMDCPRVRYLSIASSPLGCALDLIAEGRS
jgi:hypothetical protein